MSDFDDLTPRYAHTHVPREVSERFVSAGLAEVQALPVRPRYAGVNLAWTEGRLLLKNPYRGLV
jgi:hypothetical protein